MGDISAEPSMEEILSSIKRIIAEEGDGAQPRPRRTRLGSRDDDGDSDEVLELSQRIEEARPPRERVMPEREEAPLPKPTPAPAPPTAAAPAFEPAAPETLADPAPRVSAATIEEARGKLETLTRLVVKPDPGSDGTLEGLVRDMLRPMIASWLDKHLPTLVEEIVEREIARITENGAR